MDYGICQVVKIYKEIAYKIAETVHFAKHRPQRGAGVRGRAAQEKTPSFNDEGADTGVVFHPTTGICGVAPVVELSPFLEHFGVGEQVAAFSVLVVHLFHNFYFLSFFVSLLYHILLGLSSIFFYFSCGIIHPTGHRATRHRGGLRGSPSTAQGPAHRSNR